MLIVRGLIGGAFQIALFAAALLIPAGTWNWPRAIQFLVAYGIVLSAATVWLAIVAPASLEARLEPPVNEGQAAGDKLATAILIVALIAWITFIPLDVFRFHLLPAPALGVSAFGAALFFFGFGIVISALYQNSFATPVVRDQTARGHTLVDTGPYARVRHPFYTGLGLFMIGLALWLQSYAAVLAVLLVFLALLPRITVEEATLQNTLPGYTEYMERVRYRLLPGIW